MGPGRWAFGGSPGGGNSMWEGLVPERSMAHRVGLKPRG